MMKVPKGTTLYIGKKVLKAGEEIPPALENKFSNSLNKSEKNRPVKKSDLFEKETDKK